MIDKRLELYYVFLCKNDLQNDPAYPLPQGYTFAFYQRGDEKAWAELEYSLGQFTTVESGLEAFEKEFLTGAPLKPEERLLFVKSPRGRIVATCTLWEGNHLGSTLGRFHWLAVSDECAGQGIAKALFSRLFVLARELGYEAPLYLMTGTWYYPAIGMYKKLGFEFYRGEYSPFRKLSNEQFREQNEKAIALIEEKLRERKKDAR